MRSQKSRILPPILVALVLVVGSTSTAAVPPTGQAAPDFALRSITGKNLRLSEQRGQVVLINFWATWCAPCRQELPLLNKIYDRYRSAGFTLWAINIEEDTARAAKMVRDMRLTFPVLFDNDRRVSRLYDPSVMPTTVLVGRDGRVRHVHLGYKPGYEEIYERQVRELVKE